MVKEGRNPADIDAVILCGGMGTRLRSVVTDCPKPMVEINGRPFLDFLVEYVINSGFRRFILCTGYKGDVIREYYQAKKGLTTFLISEEKEALGTGGAIKNAEAFIQSRIFLVLNGDSYCEINLHDFLSFHTQRKAMVSIALTAAEGQLDCGVVRLNEEQKIISFNEKEAMNGTGLVNAGVYIFDRAAFKQMPTGKGFSLERDFFPGVLDKGVYGYVTNSKLLDIGTPERLELARQYFSHRPKGVRPYHQASRQKDWKREEK